MSDAKHTPGSWKVVTSRDVYSAVIAPGMATICVDVESDADAHLIAAAPELLAALEAALPWVAVAMAGRQYPHPKAVENHNSDLAMIQAAIAKAKGGAA